MGTERYYHISFFNKHIGAKIRANWGIQRMFSWLKGKCPIHGESLILSQILIVSKVMNRQFKERSIKRIMAKFDEKLPIGTKRYILNLS